MCMSNVCHPEDTLLLIAMMQRITIYSMDLGIDVPDIVVSSSILWYFKINVTI